MTAVLLSSGDALARIGGDLPYMTVHRWIRNGAITPTRPPAGTGTETGWSPHDVLMLEQIAHVRGDLETLGLPCPWKLVRTLWNDLNRWDYADLYTDTVTISIRLGAED